MTLVEQVRELVTQSVPLPGGGATSARHTMLIEAGRRDLSLARLAEAHWDAVAILAEAGRAPVPGALYGVWASELPGRPLRMDISSGVRRVSGIKRFCSGAGLLDRALITVAEPEHRLFDCDLRAHAHRLSIDTTEWKTTAFAETQTATVVFNDIPVEPQDLLCGPRWYLERPGFWAGACGPAACWAGGAIALVGFALSQTRSDAHTLAHLGAVRAGGWALRSFLDTAGKDLDTHPNDFEKNCITALTTRHLVEQASTDILRRIARAYGPAPLAMNADISRRHAELQLYLLQCHAERDLEFLGQKLLLR